MTAVIRVDASTSDEALERLGVENPGWKIERDDDGSILVSPTWTGGGSQSGEAFAQLYAHAKRAGGKAFDAQTGFKTVGGGVLCPDAAWLDAATVGRFAGERGYWQTMPTVAIEVASEWDSWPQVTAKIDRYIAEGGIYAIAIDPKRRVTYARGTPPPGLDLDVEAIIAA